MFGRSKTRAFKPVPYMRQRNPRRVPRWLIILLTGVALGAGGLYYIQENHLPPRLGFEESQRLQAELADTTEQRQRLQDELKKTTEQLASTQGGASKSRNELADAQATIDRLQKDLTQFIQALPPDPRGGQIGIRMGDFKSNGGQLNYHVVCTVDRRRGEAFKGSLQLVVAGQKAGGGDESLTVENLPMALAAVQQFQGAKVLPAGFTPTQVTVKVLDGPNGRLVSMRVFRLS